MPLLETTKCYLKYKINSQIQMVLSGFKCFTMKTDKVTVITGH